ncbi:MAG TPA: 7TM diverse intracellular signaling domain-containing protein [Ramlibacter sp.]|jgi:diguanylate cyclase (GGDEF)-like protein|uniref:sensor domain-containing diguanylate cyclase n=1 Tax=Ramlibacter sp. TaxID=1917967 RepID=UPI002D3B18CD|nr:7TM diverse intracellular signaling domain-containing protein [Ramlibacter sp.]HZY19822.1 7TM diverse intracellular signaling domain-containing protein [Ramlibacter sp.]
MPSPRRTRAAARCLAWLAGWLLPAALVLAQAPPQAPVPLADHAAPVAAEVLARAWLDTHGSAGIEDVVRGASLAPLAAGTIHPLGPDNALWVRLRLQRGPAERQQWLLSFPNPLLDHVDLWQQDERGRWRVQSAGNSLAVNLWPEPGRYPSFRLDLPAGQVRDVYVQIRSGVRSTVPMRLTSDAMHSRQLQRESLLLGACLGALLLLVTACLVQSWAYRDRIYGWYALYAAISTLCAAAYTGVAAQLLWPWSGFLSDVAPGALACLGAGAAILFVRDLTGTTARHPRIGRFASAAGWSGALLALLYLLAPRHLAVQLMSGYLVLTAALNIVLAASAWRSRDPVGFWVLVAYLPLAATVVATVLRMLGWLAISVTAQDAAVVAMVADVPLLLVALSLRTRDRHGAQIREQALSSQDALTGLLAPLLFQDRLQQVVARFHRDRSDAAIIFIDLVNHPRIKAAHGPAVAEQSLLRSVIKLRRVVRDVDTVGRIGEARFGLILEGASSRPAVAERAARLIAAGLMPLPGLKPDVTLHFHVAAVLLRERIGEPAAMAHALAELLASMSPRTRRPIRFVEPEDTQPADIAPDSEFPLPATAGAA